jgi:agmatine/peptidylarginine deiminase
VVAATWKKLDVHVLVTGPEAQEGATAALLRAGVPLRELVFVQIPFDSIWARDYGPMVVVSADGTSALIDAEYGHGERAGDDSVPAVLAQLFGMQTVNPPLTVDGGNLLSNGAGVLVATTALLEHNADRGYGEEQVAHILGECYGGSHVVFLEPLSGEQTGHVDVFATFVSADTIVVGEYDPQVDAVNAEILDRNADRLATVQTPNGPLNVCRIPMPSNAEGVWRTYTNVLYANGTLLVPTYPGVDPQGQETAFALYRDLLPGWTVVGIDCSGLIEWGGAIHCITRNLCHVPRQSNVARNARGGLPGPAGPMGMIGAEAGPRPFPEETPRPGEWDPSTMSRIDRPMFTADGLPFSRRTAPPGPGARRNERSPGRFRSGASGR